MPDLNRAYQWAINTCNAPNVGYSQDYRNQQTINGITYYDCSSFINYALLAGGWVTPQYAPAHNPLTTWSLMTELPRLGWTQVNPTGLILAGDIGVSNTSDSHHTEMAYSQGNGSAIFMGAHGSKGIALANQVSIGDSSGNATATRTFQTLWRYGSGGAEGYGSSLYVISALCGNAWRESHVNPGFDEEGSGTGWGLFQWTDNPRYNTYRRRDFETWCTQNGFAFDDPYAQLQYLTVENFWQGSYGGISSLTEFLTSPSTDINLLVTAWLRCWEIAGVEALDERLDFANKALAYIPAHAQDTSIIEWYSGQRYLSESEGLHNSVLLYRYLSTGGGGGTLGKAKQMPLWMKIRYHY